LHFLMTATKVAGMSDTQMQVDELIEKVRMTLDDLIREIQAMFPDEPLRQLASAVEVAVTVGQVGDHLVSHFIDVSRSAGESWAAIGARLGISRQAVQKRYSSPAGSGDGKLPAVFEKMVNPGRRAIVAAERESLRRHVGYIGTEHLLLGVVTKPECVGARALAACGSGPQIVTAAINGRVGLPGEPAPGAGRVPFTNKAKSVLDHAIRESVRLGHDFVGTGHLALGCLTVSGGMAGEVLANLGVSYDDLRKAVTELAPEEQPPAPVGDHSAA
jgi:ClpA/ClpB-like protein